MLEPPGSAAVAASSRATASRTVRTRPSQPRPPAGSATRRRHPPVDPRPTCRSRTHRRAGREPASTTPRRTAPVRPVPTAAGRPGDRTPPTPTRRHTVDVAGRTGTHRRRAGVRRRAPAHRLRWNSVTSLENNVTRLGGLGLGSGKDGAVDILLVGTDSRTDAQGNPLSPAEQAKLHAGDEVATNTDTILLIRVPNDGRPRRDLHPA